MNQLILKVLLIYESMILSQTLRHVNRIFLPSSADYFHNASGIGTLLGAALPVLFSFLGVTEGCGRCEVCGADCFLALDPTQPLLGHSGY